MSDPRLIRVNHHPMWILRFLLLFMASMACATGVFGQVSKQGDSAVVRVKKPAGGLDQAIDYKASDSIIFDIKRNKVYLFNDAVLIYGDLHLTAHYIEIDLTRKEIFAKGGVDSAGRYANLPVLKDGDESYKADSMRYNSNSKKGRVYGLRLTQEEAVIHLNKVLKNEDGSFAGQNGKITTCDADHPHFYFNASKIKVVPNNKVFFGAANLVVEDVPTPLAIPFGLAPIKKGRRNGILFPGYGYNQFNKSFYLQNFGYYTGLGEFADLTLSTDAYLNGDLRLSLGSNIVKRYRYRSNVNLSGSWFGNGAERTSPAFKRNADFSLRGGFAFDNKFLPGITLNGDLNVQTGNFNRLNSRNINDISRQQFQSSINFGRSFLKNKVNLAASARHLQNTATRDFRLELPSINLGVSSLTPFARKNSSGQKWYEQIRLSYNMAFNNVLNTKDTILFSKDYRTALKKTQNGIQHSIPIATNIKLLKGIVNLSPNLNYRETWYFKATDKFWDTASKTVQTKDVAGLNRINSWDVSASMNTNIYGTFQGLKAGKIRALRHTITPSVSVGYRPKISALQRGWQSTYTDSAGKSIKYNRFETGIFGGGNDQAESGSLGFGLNNNLQAKKVVSVDSAGNEKLDKVNLIDQFSITGSYNFFAKTLKMSDINANLNTTLLKKINITAGSGFSIYDKDSFARGAQRFQWDVNKSPVRMRRADVSLSTRLSPEMFGGKAGKEKPDTAAIEAPSEYFHYDMPWSMQFAWVFGYNAEIANRDLRVQNRINFSGDFNLTPEWKIGFTSGYDLVRKEIAASQFTVTRNLHCWQIDFSWIPSGFAKQWMFTLRPKAGMLQDLKIPKRAYSNPAMF